MSKRNHCPNCTAVVTKDALSRAEGLLHEAMTAASSDDLEWLKDVLDPEHVDQVIEALEPLN